MGSHIGQGDVAAPLVGQFCHLDAHHGGTHDDSVLVIPLGNGVVQLDGIVHSAHTECAFQAGKTARHKGRGTGGHKDLIVSGAAAVLSGDGLGSRVHGSHPGVRDDIGFVLPGNAVQRAKGEQPLVGQAACRVIGGQHGVVRRHVGIAVHIHNGVTACLTDGPQGVVARAPKPDDRKTFHGFLISPFSIGFFDFKTLFFKNAGRMPPYFVKSAHFPETAEKRCASFLGIPFPRRDSVPQNSRSIWLEV